MYERAKWGRELHYKRLSFLGHLFAANIKTSLVKIGKQNYIFHLELSPSCSFRLVNSKTKIFAASCFIMMVVCIIYLFIYCETGDRELVHRKRIYFQQPVRLFIRQLFLLTIISLKITYFVYTHNITLRQTRIWLYLWGKVSICRCIFLNTG